MLVWQSVPRIDHYRRQGDGSWTFRVAKPGGAVELACGARLEVDAIFEGAFELEGD